MHAWNKPLCRLEAPHLGRALDSQLAGHLPQPSLSIHQDNMKTNYHLFGSKLGVSA